MSDYDLIPDSGAGDIQPYIQPDTPLAPSDNGWEVPAPDFIDDHQSFSNTAPQIFGTDFPGSPQQAQQRLDQIGSAFRADAAHMRLDSALVDVAVNWLKANALLPMGHVEKRHKYNLEGFRIPKSDLPAVHSFCNAMWRAGAPQRFIANSLWWINEIGKQQSQPQPQSASQDSLTDEEWAYVEKRCESDKAACDAALRSHWGSQYKINMSIIKEYMATLPVQEREYLESTVCKGGILSGNSPEVIISIYKAAIGAMPRTGAGIAAEIAQLEKYMRENRSAYNRDSIAQARLRELYSARDGG